MTDLPVTVLDEAPADWNEWVAKGIGGPYQTRQFGEYWREMLGYRPKFLVAGDVAGPSGILLAFVYSPLHRRLNSLSYGASIGDLVTPLVGCIGFLDGPVILDTPRDADVCAALLWRATRLAGPLGGLWGRGLCHYSRLSLGPDLSQMAPRLPGRLEVHHTPLIRPGPDTEVVWSDLPKEARKAVRKAEKQGISVRCLDGSDTEQARRFWALCDREKGGKSYGDRLPVTSSQVLAVDGFHVCYFIAYLGDEPISGIGLHAYADSARELAAWNTPRCLADGLCGGDAIKWEVIRWCVANGILTYDLAGIRLRPGNPKETGIARFKKKWTQEIVPVFSVRTSRALVSA